MSMPTNLMGPSSSSHVVFTPEHVSPAPRSLCHPLPQIVVTLEPTSHTIGEKKRVTRDTTSDDERDINEDNAHKNEHMRARQNATNVEEPYLNT